MNTLYIQVVFPHQYSQYYRLHGISRCSLKHSRKNTLYFQYSCTCIPNTTCINRGISNSSLELCHLYVICFNLNDKYIYFKCFELCNMSCIMRNSEYVVFIRNISIKVNDSSLGFGHKREELFCGRS